MGRETRVGGRVVPPTDAALTEPGQRMRGVHAGAVVFVGIAAANAGNAVFHLIAGRWLGPASYGDVASLLALLGLVAFPLAAAQFAMAQYVADYAARRDADAIAGLYRRSLAVGLGVGAALTLLFAAAAEPVRNVLGVASLGAVLLTAMATIPAFLTPVIWGLAQGLERFVLFSAAQTAGPLLRILFVVPFLALGFGVAGALGAVLAGTLVAAVVPAWLLRGWLARAARRSPVSAREAVRALGPTFVGILALTSLTTIDVIVAKIVFSDHAAGLYGGASLIGRLILYLPAAIVAVLLPKVASRAALGRETADILRASLLATGALCAAVACLYAVAPRLVLGLAFGGEYERAADFLWMFAVAMTGFALVNVVLAYHIARRSASASWLLLGGAAVQVVVFAVVHDSPQELLTVSIALAYTLFAISFLLPARRTAASRPLIR
jgi:O-antigen/teichoic acid export membrane protein